MVTTIIATSTATTIVDAICDERDFYVDATNGDNTKDGRTPATAWKTVARVNAETFIAGDHIYFKSGEHWHEQLSITDSGVIGNHIVFSSYDTGDMPAFDGDNYTLPTPTENYEPLIQCSGDYVTIDGLETRYSSGMGILNTGNYSIIQNCYSHHNHENGIFTNGDYSVIEYCTVYSNCMSNYQAPGGVIWASGLSCGRSPTGATLRHNTVYENWGEGLSTYEAYNSTLEDNVVYDNWSLNIYISDTDTALCQRNLVYNTGVMTPYYSGTVRGYGILLQDETSLPANSDITVINNICMFNNRNLYMNPGSSDSISNVLVAGNTFYNSTRYRCVDIQQYTTMTNVRFIDNIIEQNDAIALIFLVATAGMTFSYNNWNKAPQADASGTGDIVSDPLLYKTGSEYLPGYYKPTASSPGLNAGTYLIELISDYEETSRDASPNMGAYETNEA